FFSSRRRHTRSYGDWSSDVCSSDLIREMAELDAGLRVSTRALGGGDLGRGQMVEALRHELRECPDDLGARLAVARLCDQAGDERSEERRVGKEWRGRGCGDQAEVES